jgi:uncharacterized membrane protein YkoI
MWNNYSFGPIMKAIVKLLLLAFFLGQHAYAGKEVVFSLLTLDQATKKIIEQQNKVMGAKTEEIDGKEVHVIKVLTSDGRVQYINVDAETGKIIK